MVGPGGRGKTRLALELARAISQEGWLGGFLEERELDRFRRDGAVEEWRWDKPVLVIVDYAASRSEQIRSWLRELIDASMEGRPKLRLLLLERQANRTFGWLAMIFGSGYDDSSRAAISMLDPLEPVELPALDELETRRELFATLLKRSNATLEAPLLGADSVFDRALAERVWAGDPLYVMMAGIVAAKAGVQAALSLSRADLALLIAQHELDRVGRIGATHGIDKLQEQPGAFVRHMGVMATLTQGLTRAEARALAKTERGAVDSAAALDATIAALTNALPMSDENEGIGPILPDIIGEAAILSWLGPQGGLLSSGINPAEAVVRASRVALAKVSSTLVRMAQDFSDADCASPIRWLEALVSSSDANVDALIEIADALPRETVALAEFAHAITEQISQSLRNPAAAEERDGLGLESQSSYAAWLRKLGTRLKALGRYEEAVAATTEAVTVYRRLVGCRPDTFLPELAKSLSNLGAARGELFQYQPALEAALEATDMFKRLAEARPDAFLYQFEYAVSLNNLAGRYKVLGKRDEAVQSAAKAVDILRPLATARPGDFLDKLGFCLSNLSDKLGNFGWPKEALAPNTEAISIFRVLAVEKPDSFRAHLARALHNFGELLADLGRRDELSRLATRPC
jgi:tetratricopeptide (TPR) repeat protein